MGRPCSRRLAGERLDVNIEVGEGDERRIVRSLRFGQCFMRVLAFDTTGPIISVGAAAERTRIARRDRLVPSVAKGIFLIS